MTVDRRFALLGHADHPNGLLAGPNNELQVSAATGAVTLLAPSAAGATLDVTLRTDTAAGVLFHGGSYGLRFGANGTGIALEGVDNTGVGSYQPVKLGGSTVALQIAGATKWLLDASGNLSNLLDGSSSANFFGVGASNDFAIYHDGTDTRLRNFTGKLRLYHTDYGFTIQPPNTLQGSHAHGVSLTTINQSAAGRLVTNTAGVNHSMHGFSDSEGLEISAGSTAGFIAGIALNPGGATTPGVRVFSPAGEAARFDSSATATHTRFMVYDVDNGALERVTVGAADSGGAGFKVLRIPN